MIQFDKLKIVTNIRYISNINKELFIENKKGNEILYYKYKQKTPYNLIIIVNYFQNELVIEFTSKILKDKFIELINKDNIKECISNINQLNICQLDVDDIINNSEVVKCDITKDIIYDNINEITEYININRSNYQKWNCKNLNNGLILENIAATPRNKKRITIYNKEKEIKKSENIPYLNILSDKNKVFEHFKNKIRFELNINTKIQIRKLLSISNNNLLDVLSSNENPIITIFDEAITSKVNHNKQSTNLREYERELLIKECEYDLSKVELTIRKYTSKNTSIKRIMKPYIELNNKLNNQSHKNINLKELLK
ncbi:hypothetical protein HCH04_24085 [Bacteroides thetaiotaomicron]|jgi:hypothetical protein|uniref:hypothetical protein n=1 Tax=Bacteroides thetaiotaomicron TaxID=818 RepID=UPI001C8C1C39|nr:hypothetical protein [Bacteroides thetaiotaomicron]MBX9051384.1 hypothetical protein [Bacteroides thetaiotaomicron]MBX9074911.1 hypothetical protein [Bacteroides thetaiotaomicron]